MMGRPVIDATGVTGRFDIHLESSKDEDTAGTAPGPPDAPTATTPSDPPGGTSIFAAIQRELGLKLDPAKGPHEYIVIDHVERPTAN
jgi:uncharacterized protein (TIGR03435 family)